MYGVITSVRDTDSVWTVDEWYTVVHTGPRCPLLAALIISEGLRLRVLVRKSEGEYEVTPRFTEVEITGRVRV